MDEWHNMSLKGTKSHAIWNSLWAHVTKLLYSKLNSFLFSSWRKIHMAFGLHGLKFGLSIEQLYNEDEFFGTWVEMLRRWELFVHCNVTRIHTVSSWNSLGYFNQSLSWIPLQFVLRLRSGYTSSLSARVYLTIYYTLWVFTEQDLHIKNTLAILCLYLDWSCAVLKKKFTLVYLYLHDEKIYIFLLTKQLKIGLSRSA